MSEIKTLEEGYEALMEISTERCLLQADLERVLREVEKLASGFETKYHSLSMYTKKTNLPYSLAQAGPKDYITKRAHHLANKSGTAPEIEWCEEDDLDEMFHNDLARWQSLIEVGEEYAEIYTALKQTQIRTSVIRNVLGKQPVFGEPANLVGALVSVGNSRRGDIGIVVKSRGKKTIKVNTASGFARRLIANVGDALFRYYWNAAYEGLATEEEISSYNIEAETFRLRVIASPEMVAMTTDLMAEIPDEIDKIRREFDEEHSHLADWVTGSNAELLERKKSIDRVRNSVNNALGGLHSYHAIEAVRQLYGEAGVEEFKKKVLENTLVRREIAPLTPAEQELLDSAPKDEEMKPWLHRMAMIRNKWIESSEVLKQPAIGLCRD